jgi:hypothetical protein
MEVVAMPTRVMDCYCDEGDPPRFYWSRRPKSRKEWKCDECGGSSKSGERYERVTASWEAPYIDTFTTCARCVDLRTWVENNIPCLCWSHGNSDQAMAEAIEDATFRAPDETRGLWFGFLRRKVLRDRHNKQAGAA